MGGYSAAQQQHEEQGSLVGGSALTQGLGPGNEAAGGVGEVDSTNDGRVRGNTLANLGTSSRSVQFSQEVGQLEIDRSQTRSGRGGHGSGRGSRTSPAREGRGNRTLPGRDGRGSYRHREHTNPTKYVPPPITSILFSPSRIS